MTNDCLNALPEFPDFFDRTFGQHPHLQGLMLSSPKEYHDASLISCIIPDPEKMRRILPETIDRTFELGLDIRELDGPCGPPLCVFGAEHRIPSLEPVTEELNFRIHLPACDTCAVKKACFGVRTADVAQYGDACVMPLSKPRR